MKAIARALRKAGYASVHRKGRPVGDEHPGRFEAPHRNALWQLDFTELRVGAERRYLLVIEDDFSRFVVGHALVEGPTTEVVVTAMKEAIRLHGKCERVYTDRGGRVHGLARRDGVRAVPRRRAHRPLAARRAPAAGRGQDRVGHRHRAARAVGGRSLRHGRRRRAGAGAFFADYNHRRAHTGIGGLVPADRFFGRWPEVVAEMDALSRRRQGALALVADRRLFVEPPAAGERAVVLQLVVVGEEAELHVLGRRIRLGRVVGSRIVGRHGEPP